MSSADAAGPFMTSSSRRDPIEFEVFKNLFVSVAEEMGVTLRRTAFSPNIKERLDYSCAIYDADGQTVAQGDHMPVHLGAMPLSVRAAIESGPILRGEMIALNDPFRGGTHLPDITLVAPVFLGRDSKPAYYVANRAHHSDVGGMSPGSMPLASEIFQEGLILPPVRLVRDGRLEEDLARVILANVRTPTERLGDLAAQMAANSVAERRMQEVVSRYGRTRVDHYAGDVQDYTERVLRATIEALPDGDYAFEDALEDDGFGAAPLSIRVRVAIAGGSAVVDFAGTHPQTTGGVNANFAITLSATLYAFRCLVRDDVLYNAGIARPLVVRAPPGSLVNAQRPAAVAGGNVETSQRITDVVLGALSQALPGRVPAASQGTMNNVTLGGHDPSTGLAFAYYETLGGGMGGRNGLPGLNGVHTHMSNTRNTPIEGIEHYLPLRMVRYGLRPGTGGAGAFRGGDGLVREYEALTAIDVTILSERRTLRPWGVQGGEPGHPGRNTIRRADGALEELPSKCHVRLRPGDRLCIETPGGGGYGVARGDS